MTLTDSQRAALQRVADGTAYYGVQGHVGHTELLIVDEEQFSVIARFGPDLARLALNAEKLAQKVQDDVDTIVHYRNLAILLGAKPGDMLNAYDRRLCETKYADDPTPGERQQVNDVWAENEMLTSQRERLADALMAVVHADCAAGRTPPILDSATGHLWNRVENIAALRLLAELGKVRITEDDGDNRVVAEEIS